MKPSIEKLDAGLQEIIESQGRSSKAKIIRGLFERITEAMEEGITLDMLVDYLRQNDILITKNTLRNTLYRIRKERGHSPPSTTTVQPKSQPPDGGHETPIPEPIPTSQPTPPAPDTYDRLMEQYMACNNPVDRYVALGGKREDIEEKNISTQRSMVSQLRTKLRQKYKGIYS